MKFKSFKIWKIRLIFLTRKTLYYNLILQEALFQSAKHLYEKKGRIRIRPSDLQIRKTQNLTVEEGNTESGG